MLHRMVWNNPAECLQAWVKHRWQLRPSEPLAEPQGIPLEIQGRLSLAETRLMMLVGLPGESWKHAWLPGIMQPLLVSLQDYKKRDLHALGP